MYKLLHNLALTKEIKMDSREVFEEFKDNIDSIVYSNGVKSMPVDSIFEVNWKDSLGKPPSNTSLITINELEYLERITKIVSPQDKELVHSVDKDPFNLFIPILKKNNLPFDKKKVDKTWDLVWSIIYNLKFKFNRPRPEQLAPLYGMNVNVITTKTHQTPAYPSGHTSHAAVCAYILADTYPKYSSEFFSKVGLAGYARCVQGVHYPSDNEAAMTIVGVLWQDLKYKLFPEL